MKDPANAKRQEGGGENAASRPAGIENRDSGSAAGWTRRRWVRLTFGIGSLLLLGILASYLLWHSTPPRTAQASAKTAATIARNPMETNLRLAGTTAAVNSRSILAPQLAGAQIGAMVVTRLAPAGTRVKKGELLVEFDRQAQMKDYLDKQASYENLVDQIAEKQAAEDAARATDDTDLQAAKDALKKAQLEMQKNEVVSRIDVEKNQEALAEAQSNLKQLEATYQLKRQAAAAGIRVLEIQRDQAKATMDYAKSNAAKMSIHSPMDGIVVLNMVWLEGRMDQIQEGDQIRPGVPFMRVVDPSKMEVRADVNQEDVLKLHLGQSAVVHLDAYPSLSFPATLAELDPLGTSGQFSSTIRTFAAVFAIQGSDPKLMPDLSASVDVKPGGAGQESAEAATAAKGKKIVGTK